MVRENFGHIYTHNSVHRSIWILTCSAIARSLAASVAASSTNAAIVVEEEIAESKSAGGGGNVKWSSAKDTLKITYELSQSSMDYNDIVLSYAILNIYLACYIRRHILGLFACDGFLINLLLWAWCKRTCWIRWVFHSLHWRCRVRFLRHLFYDVNGRNKHIRI